MVRNVTMLGWYAMLLALLAACSSNSEFRIHSNCKFREHSGDPTPPPKRAVQACIAAFDATSPDKRPSDIRKVWYDGKPAYLVESPCCDQFNYLYDAQGLRLCAPSGGFTGDGDGKCTGVITPEDSARARRPPESVPQQ